MSPKVADLAIKRGQRYVSDEKGNDAGSCEFFLASTKLSVTSDNSGTELFCLELRRVILFLMCQYFVGGMRPHGGANCHYDCDGYRSDTIGGRNWTNHVLVSSTERRPV